MLTGTSKYRQRWSGHVRADNRRQAHIQFVCCIMCVRVDCDVAYRPAAMSIKLSCTPRTPSSYRSPAVFAVAAMARASKSAASAAAKKAAQRARASKSDASAAAKKAAQRAHVSRPVDYTVFFDDGCLQGMMDGAATAPTTPAIEETHMSLAGLSLESVTRLMVGRSAFNVPKPFWKVMKMFRAGSFEEQVRFLERDMIYIFHHDESSRIILTEEDDMCGSVAADTEQSDPDWGTGSELSSDDDGHDRGNVPPAKRMRIAAKSSWVHLDQDGTVACRPVKQDDCQWSMEIDGIWRVDFGYRAYKPKILYRWGGNCDQPSRLYLITVRETGAVYYGRRPAESSRYLQWMSTSYEDLSMREAVSLQKMLARTLLLLSPSKFHPIDWGAVSVEFTGTDFNTKKVDASDGMARCSVGFYQLLSLPELPTATSISMYVAVQWRSLVWHAARNVTVQCKGTCVVDPSMSGISLQLPDSVVKLVGTGYCNDLAPFYGVYLTRTTKKVLKKPRLNPELFSTLAQRAAMQSTAEKRKAAHYMLDAFLEECKADAHDALLCKSYGINRETDSCISWRLVSNEDDTSWVKSCVPFGRFALKHREHPQCALTDLSILTHTVADSAQHILERGTKRSLSIGNSTFWMKYNSQWWKPALEIPAWGGQAMAFSNIFDQALPDRHCFWISDGCAQEGELVMWRSPNHLPWDVELHTAVLPDVDCVSLLTDNSVYLSREGYVNSIMGGGDLDGDLNAASKNEKLIAFVKFTQNDVDSFPRAALEDEVKTQLAGSEPIMFLATDPRSRVCEFVDFAQRSCTLDVKGKVATMASRAAHRLFSADEDVIDSARLATLRLGILAHTAMDVPKKKTHAEVLDLNATLAIQAGVHNMSATAVSKFEAQLYIEIPTLQRRDVLRYTKEFLDAKIGKQPRGNVWLPVKEISMGYHAGVAIGRAMRRRVSHIPHYSRSNKRSPIGDLANVFLHKLFNKQELIPDTNMLEGMSVDSVRIRLQKARTTEIAEWSTLLRSHL